MRSDAAVVSQDPYNLQRFLDAQVEAFPRAMSELASGRKVSHWMWFIFPQLVGLGQSKQALFYGISGLDEARAYTQHPTLFPRLRAGGNLMLSHEGKAPETVLGQVDAQKLRSCATLFWQEAPSKPLWPAVLRVFFDGQPCPQTMEMLNRTGHVPARTAGV